MTAISKAGSKPFAWPGEARGVETLGQFKRAILFGAGASAVEVEKVLEGFGIVIVAFCDNSAAKQGTQFRGLPIIGPGDLTTYLDDETAIIISSVYQSEISTQLAALGIPETSVFPFISPMFAGHFGEAAFQNSEGLDRLAARFEDEASRSYLEALISFRWTMNPSALKRNPCLTGFYTYLHADLGPSQGDHIVDVGAFDGDSAVAYLKRLSGHARVSALEPLPQNLAALEQTIATHEFGRNIAAIPFGAGATPSTAEIDSDADDIDPRATLRGKDGASSFIRIETIDRLFANDRVDFIKIDIEGHDPAALEGAKMVLNRDRPGLAIAAYHAPDHLWRIPALLDDLCPGYRIFLGHHPAAAYECELFCVHESRCV